MEFDIKPKGAFGIGMSMKVKGHPQPICRYSELELEEEVVCDNCTLRYTVYGSFAYCPDCGRHNSRQILDKNLALAEQMVELAYNVGEELAQQLVADALENVVSAFDGFGRETCRVHAAKSSEPSQAENISFQNLNRARDRVQLVFGFDFATNVESARWSYACCCFQKRHLLAHRMGIVDDAYIKATDDKRAIVGRKISIAPAEVIDLTVLVRDIGSYLAAELDGLP